MEQAIIAALKDYKRMQEQIEDVEEGGQRMSTKTYTLHEIINKLAGYGISPIGETHYDSKVLESLPQRIAARSIVSDLADIVSYNKDAKEYSIQQCTQLCEDGLKDIGEVIDELYDSDNNMWQPIESAPKNRVWIYVWFTTELHDRQLLRTVEKVRWLDRSPRTGSGPGFYTNECRLIDPQAWQPVPALPEPPKEDAMKRKFVNRAGHWANHEAPWPLGRKGGAGVKRLHQCTVCKHIGFWDVSWSHYGSFAIEETCPDALIKTCSKKCEAIAKKHIKTKTWRPPEIVQRGYHHEVSIPHEGYDLQPSQHDLKLELNLKGVQE